MATAKQHLSRWFRHLIPASLEGRLRWGSFLLVVLPGVLFFLFFSTYVLPHEREEAIIRLEQGVSLRSKSITTWAINKGVKIRTLAGSESARGLDKTALAIDFQAALQVENIFNDLIFINSDGKTEVSINNLVNIDVSDSTYFKRALAGQATVAEVTMDPISSQWQLMVAAPVYSFDGGFSGAILGVMPLSAIDAVVRDVDVGRAGETYLLTETGMRFTAPRFVEEEGLVLKKDSCYLKPLDPQFAEVFSSDTSRVKSYINCQDKQVIGVQQPINELNWVIVGEIEEREMLAPVYGMLLNTSMIFFLVIFAVMPLTLVLTRTITRPLEYLLAGSESIKRLDYSYRIDSEQISNAPNELKQLCNTFNQMASTIKIHSNRLEEQISQRTQALGQIAEGLRQQNVIRRQIELSLLQSEEKYRVLFDRATDAIAITEICDDGLPGRFIDVNEKTCQTLGYGKDELLELTPAQIGVQIKKSFKSAYHPQDDDKNTLLETEYVKKSGEVIPMEVNIRKLSLGDKQIYFAIGRDLSLRRKMDQEMARLERLNLVGEMAASIGHEVRNPMTTVRGFLQMLGRKKENAANAEYFRLMIEEIDRANSIITEFLSLAKNKTVELKKNNLNTIIRAIDPLLKADAIMDNKVVDIELGTIPEVYLDEKEIRQLIFNLVRNGLEAMSSRTRLVIRTYVENNEVVLAIQDEGSGIPAEILNKLGTPFVTTKEKGTGLGLAVCYSIANRHNATIVPESSPQGTTFYVRFKTFPI